MRKTMAILASAAIALSLTACGSEPPVATCSEYAQLAPDTGLFTQMNDDQDVLLRELRAPDIAVGCGWVIGVWLVVSGGGWVASAPETRYNC